MSGRLTAMGSDFPKIQVHVEILPDIQMKADGSGDFFLCKLQIVSEKGKDFSAHAVG